MADLIRELNGERLVIFDGSLLEIEWSIDRLRDDDLRELGILRDKKLGQKLKYFIREGNEIRPVPE